MVIKATKKPVTNEPIKILETVEAVKWTGENANEIKAFCGESANLDLYKSLEDLSEHIVIHLHSVHGYSHVFVGDYIIKDVNGEFSTCKPDIFGKEYDVVPTSKDDSHNFGWALEQLKAGKKVQRKGWNVKGMFITLQEGSTVNGKLMRNAPAKEFYGEQEVHICPHIDMKAADDSYVVGWLASQTDMLAEDWQLA